MPGKARPVYLYSLLDPSPGHSAGQRRGIVRVDMRSKHGRLLKTIRKEILAHLTAQGGEPTIIQRSLAERAAQLELKLAMYDEKQLAGTFSDYDSKVYFAAVGSLRRLYKEIGLAKPSPGFAKLLKSPPEAVA